MSHHVDVRVTGRPGATVWRFMPLLEAARTFVDVNVELEHRNGMRASGKPMCFVLTFRN
jgi:hypothetical protein